MATSSVIPTPELIEQIATAVAKSTSLHASPSWINTLLLTLKPAPLPVLTKTASFRLLTTDFTTTLSSRSLTFPPTIYDASLPERALPAGCPIPVQVLGVEDLGRSKMEQIEALEAAERGETTKGRELVRVVREEGEEREERTAGPCRLVLQDVAGVRVYGIELKPVEGVKLGMFIGTKVSVEWLANYFLTSPLSHKFSRTEEVPPANNTHVQILLHSTIIARAVLLLEPATTTVLGGKIEALHATWLENRKKELMAAIGAGNCKG
ncbi:MAG: hypothetical protein M1813_005771 [Trichoglossum hirsutum]|jgi:RecQ-mediated genome instability protein 1|nr:MAG: hypothetical protein M1813_005771 [Trichoglossum hirsutum]